MQKLHEAQISMSINKAVLKHSHTCSSYIDYGYFYVTGADWVVTVKNICSLALYRKKIASTSLKETEILCDDSTSVYKV